MLYLLHLNPTNIDNIYNTIKSKCPHINPPISYLIKVNSYIENKTVILTINEGKYPMKFDFKKYKTTFSDVVKVLRKELDRKDFVLVNEDLSLIRMSETVPNGKKVRLIWHHMKEYLSVVRNK